MDRLTRLIVTLLRYSEPMVPAAQRGWARALRTEAGQIPAGWERLAWLTGGVRFTVRQAALNRGVAYPLMFAAAAAGAAWSAWSGPPGDSAIAINRVDVITISAILAGLPLAVRRARGPMAGTRQAWVIRTAGYAATLVLVLVKAAVERVADAAPNNLAPWVPAWTGELVFLAVMAGYAAVILAGTSSRSPAVPSTVAVGTAAGTAVGVLVYLLGPLGCPLRFAGWWPAHLYDAATTAGALLALCAPVAAGRAAARRAPAGSRARQAAMAGLCTGTAAALVVAALSTATIALLPYDTALRTWAEGHVGQWTPLVGQVAPVVGIRLGYVAGASAFAAGYLIVLVLSPAAAWGAGAWAGRAAGRPDPAGPPRPDASRQARAGTSLAPGHRVARMPLRYRLPLRYGRPLLDPAARRRASALLACCVILVAVLGILFAHHSTPGRLDHAIDAPVIARLGGHHGLALWLAAPGSQLPAVALSAAIVIACLLTGRLNGALLAAAAVPAAVGLNDGLCKPLVHRTYLGALSYPSGHTATMFALAATVVVLLYGPSRSARAGAVRIAVPAAACVLGGVVAVGVIGLRWHYFTDTVAGAAVGIGTVCALALLLDLPSGWRRRSAAGAPAGS